MSVINVREKHCTRYTKLLELMKLNSYEYKNTKVDNVELNSMSEQEYIADYHDARRFEVFKEQLRSLVSNKTKIEARECLVQSIDAKISNQFLNKYQFHGLNGYTFIISDRF